MTTRDRLTVASAVAVLLACSALLPVFDGLGWLVRVVGAVLAVSGGAALARYLGVPRALQPLAGLLGLAAYVGLVFAGSTLAYGIAPTGETLTVLRAALEQGLLDAEALSPPVPSNDGLVLLAALGAGAVVLAVDTLAVVLRQAAASGLPLLVLFAVPSAVLPGGLGVVPFVAGAAGWLGLLLADSSDTVSRWGTPLQSRRVGAVSDPSLGRVGRRIGVAALGVAVIVPALVPGLDARLLGSGEGDGFGGGSRSVTTYNPITRLAGQLSLPEPRELLRYTTTDPSPDYVRLTTLDVFDEGAGWSSSELSGDPDEDRAQDGNLRPQGLSTPRDSYEARFELAGQLDGPWLPVPVPPTDVDVRGPWLWDEQAQTVFSTRTSLARLDEPYGVTADRLRPTVEALRDEQTVPSEILETYAVPPQLSEYVQRELDRAVAGQSTDYDRVAALQAYFRDPDRFSYDADATSPGINAPDALERFLRSGQGYCEQYSSAMAAMVRGLGIPARVAVGFTPGVRDGDQYVISTSEAHAWPEVWFQGAGWIRFEPTPRTDDQESTPAYSTAPVEQAPDPAASVAPSVAPSTPSTLPDDQAPVDRGAEALDPAGAGSSTGGLSPWLLLVPAVLLVLGAPWLLARVRSRRRWARADPLTAWDAVTDDAVDVGHRWRPSDSPRSAAAHLLAVRPLGDAPADALRRLAAAAERSRYARPSEVDRHDGDGLRRDVAAVRAGLLGSVTGRTRWLARLAPPSTLRWASAGVGSRVADLLDRVDATLTAVGARLRHPRTRRAA